MNVTVESLKMSLRIDHYEDDDLLSQLISTAYSYIIGAIDSNYTDNSLDKTSQLNWAVSLLAQHWYLNRQEASSERIPVTVQAMIQQLRGIYYANH